MSMCAFAHHTPRCLSKTLITSLARFSPMPLMPLISFSTSLRSMVGVSFRKLVSVTHKERLQFLTGHFLYGAICITIFSVSCAAPVFESSGLSIKRRGSTEISCSLPYHINSSLLAILYLHRITTSHFPLYHKPPRFSSGKQVKTGKIQGSAVLPFWE